MKELTRKLTITAGALALSVGMLGATVASADAHVAKGHVAKVKIDKSATAKDSRWPY